MHPKVLPVLVLIFATAAPALAAARLEVLPGYTSARPGARIRLTAVAWVGPKDKPVATLPPSIQWSTSAGQIDSGGLLMIPTEAPPQITVRARVGAMEAKAVIRIRRQDLVVLPNGVRLLSGKSLRFTALDFSGGFAKTPAKIEWEAERGLVTSSGRYRAPDTSGPDTITIKIGDRVATAQILIVGKPGKVTPRATPPSGTPAPRRSPLAEGEPWKIRSWTSSGGFSSKSHKIVLDVYHPDAATIKTYISRVGGKESISGSRVVKPGGHYTLTLSLAMTSTGARVALYDAKGKLLASRTRGK
ncbi:MAG: hypothetical protein JKY65_13800 [Planctomycetes bacterium]|nr:hypothetical protein [Planctomycetota bacterium]